MRTIAFTTSFGFGALSFGLILALNDWARSGAGVVPSVIAIALLGLYAVGGLFAKGFPGVGGSKLTLLLFVFAGLELLALVVGLAVRSTSVEVSNGALIAGAIAAAANWLVWNGFSWFLRLQGQSEEDDLRPQSARSRTDTV